MDIYEITGDNLRVFLNELDDPKDIRIVRIAIEEGTLKLKINEYSWTYPLAELDA